MRDRIRLVRFRPYLNGHGPTFSLELYDVRSLERIGYTLRQHQRRKTTVIFDGSDFRPAPGHAWDSDETVRALMTFLTLRPGDTDAEYFSDYTPEQIEFRDMHAEALAACVVARFTREEGR